MSYAHYSSDFHIYILPKKVGKFGAGLFNNRNLNNDMEQQQSIPLDLSTFRQHIELYEMMVESAKKRALSEIKPQLDELKKDSHPPITTYSVQRSGGGGDLWVFFALGIWLGAIAYVAYKKGYFIK